MLLQLNALGSSLSLFCDHDNNLVGPLEGVVMAGSGPRLTRSAAISGTPDVLANVAARAALTPTAQPDRQL
jgi:hypothetical protein